MTNLLGRRARGSYRERWDEKEAKWHWGNTTGDVVGVFAIPAGYKEIWILERHCGVVRVCDLAHVTILPPEILDEDPAIGAVPR